MGAQIVLRGTVPESRLASAGGGCAGDPQPLISVTPVVPGRGTGKVTHGIARDHVTHLDEPLFDGAGATKRDLVDYLEAVGDRIVCVLRRPALSVIGCARASVRSCRRTCQATRRRGSKTVSMWAESSHREVRYALCEDKPDADLVRQPARGGVPRHASAPAGT